MNSDVQVPTRVPLILRLPSPSPGNDASYYNSAQSMDKLGKNEKFFAQKQQHDFVTPSKTCNTSSSKSRVYSLHASNEIGENVEDNNISSSLRNSSFDSQEPITMEDKDEDDERVNEVADHEADERGSSAGDNFDDELEGSTLQESDSEDSDMSDEDGNFDEAHESVVSEDEMEQEDDAEEDEDRDVAGVNDDDNSEDDESDSKEFQLITHIPTGKRLAPDNDDEDSESDRDRPDVIVVFTGKLAVPVESSIGNISSEDEISSDDNDNNSTESTSSSSDEMSSASESSKSSLDDEGSVHNPECDVENHFSDMSDNESDNASGIEEENKSLADNESACADVSDNDYDSDSNSESSCNSSLEDSDESDSNSEASSEHGCESLGPNIQAQSSSNDNEEDVKEYIGFSKEQGTGREQIQMIEKLSQTDSISIEELEGIINASPKEDDISEFDMNFSDSEKQPATWLDDSECESNHKSSNKSPREEFENRQTNNEDCSPNRSTKKVKRNLSCNMLSSLPLPLNASPKRFRSISTSESTTNEDEEKDTKCKIKSGLPPLPPLGQRDSMKKVHTKSSLSAFCDRFIHKTQTADGKSSQDSSYSSIPLLTPDDSTHVECSEDAGTTSICEWPSNADFDNTITSVFTMKGQSPHSSQGDDRLMSFASPPRINEKEQASTASCSLTPKLQSISVSFR